MNGGLGVGGGAEEVSLLAEELARAVELTMDPTAIQEARLQAYNACESFKENSPWCAQAGLLLASNPQHSAVVRHFGLQLMEHTVKYKWTQISQAEKIFIKENAMKLVMGGGWEVGHLNDALARVVVEMVKREWPQQWPQLLAELSNACARGHRHTEIVLHVFLRLVEDVATLQTLESNQRRKDIYQALTGNMAEIFAFFLRLIELHMQQFRETTSSGDFAQAASNERVVQVVLLTLTGFVEWVSMNHIIGHNGRLLQILCILLGDDSFQLHAAECLLQIVNRKGQMKERKPLMVLFSEDAIGYIHRAAIASTQTLDEKHYLFLKKLAQVVAGLGQQLVALWGKGGEDDRPASLSVFLETLLVFSSHSSLTLAHAACGVWTALMKHDILGKDSALLAAVPRWLHVTAPKLLKVSYPSSRPVGVTPDASTYASIDYDSENEFGMFFCRCRVDLLEALRQATLIAPLVTFGYVEHWVRCALRQSGHLTGGSITDVVYIEWEALATVLDGVVSRLLQVTEVRPPPAAGLSLLELCLAAEPADPLLLSLLLSFISALFVFLSMSACQISQANCQSVPAALLPRVLDKIFAALMYTGGAPTKELWSRAIKNVRRHAASLMVKLAHKYPLLLLAVFPRIHSAIAALTAPPTQLSALESVTLQEALLLISNHFCDYSRQRSLIGEILGDCPSQWIAMAPHFSSAERLISFIGLDKPPVQQADNDAAGQNRRPLLHCVYLLQGIIKRCAWPDDPDKASRGGFSAGVTAGGNPVWRNPCANHVLPVISHLLALCRALNQLYAPDELQMLSEGYRNVYAMLEIDRQNLLGLSWVGQADPLDPNAKRPSTPFDRMQHFLALLQESCCQILGAAGASLGRDFYGVHGLAGALIASVLSGLEHLPDHRLRPIIRVFLKPFIHCCPPSHYNDVILPILAHIAPFMLVRLWSKWEYISKMYEIGRLEEENSNDTQEILEDMLNRNLTREYIEVLKVTLVGGALSGEACNAMDEDTPDALSQGQQTQNTNNARNDSLSELGAIVLSNEATAGPIFQTLTAALWWEDSSSSLRAAPLIAPALRLLVDRGTITANTACAALAAPLRALKTHGQHDANQAALIALAAHTYEMLRPRFPDLLQVMQQIPQVNMADVHRLDEKLSAMPTKGNKIEKAKKDLFKKITSHLIGRSVGQLFRKEVIIADLPHMTSAPKDLKAVNVLECPETTGLPSLFTQNSPS